ncbi:uncharacterized protein N7483_009841 [Penicillium malachiteum]|uniref:uncharacterized protein n=1 Tax=Penicillium malachiteum TaxID=1324776 RepID=UPI002549AC5B|nr:uncharacterized protein N7483_009841 [Penicillium malachiteum]KAJ5721907.1 hypothetical protein N7483_009841 [Penicillium malachiteum]
MAYHQQPPYGGYNPNQPPQAHGYQQSYQQQPSYPQQQQQQYPPQSYPPQQFAAPQGPPPQQFPPQGQYGQPPPGQNNYHAGAPLQPGPGYHPGPQQGGYPSNQSPQPGYNGQPQFQQGPPGQGQHQNYGPPGQAQHQNYGPPGQAQQFQQGQHQNYGPPGQTQHQNYGPPGQAHAPVGGPGFAPQGGPGGHQMSGGPSLDPPPAMPTLGYVPGQIAPGDFTRQADTLRKAMKGFGTDEKAIIQTLAPLDPLQMAAVRATYSRHIKRDLYDDVKSETGGYLERGLLSVIEGPLGSDVAWARESVAGLGTKEWLMNEALLGRSNADIRAIKTAYERKYHRNLERDVVDDLSFKTADLFKLVLQADRHDERAELKGHHIESWVSAIHANKSVESVCAIMAKASNAELRAMDQRCHMLGEHKSLETVITERFSDHMKHAFVFMIRTATDPAMRDAFLLNEAMEGLGTDDERLVVRIVRLHWNPDHKDQVKRAYRHHFNKNLIDVVRGETSGDYEKLMVALLQ